MYTLKHDGERVGKSNLESGDPAILAVSGKFHNVGGAKPIAAWIKSIGGTEDDGVVFVNLSDAFRVESEEGAAIQFQEGSLIAIPADDEVYLDLTGVSESDYSNYFAAHVSALDR